MAATLDPRLVYAKTPAGVVESTTRSALLTPPALRLLTVIDGRRPLAQLPAQVRPGELPGLVEGLEQAGLIRLAGIVDALPPTLSVDDRDPRLEAFKKRIEGTVERELGAAGRVLEARLQDAVNMTVMRSVMREIVEMVRRRASDAAAERVAAAAQEAARAGERPERDAPPPTAGAGE